MAEAEQVPEVSNGSSQPKIVLAKPRLGGLSGNTLTSVGNKNSAPNPFGSGPVLRPAQLKPVLGGNPFLRASDPVDNPKEDLPKEERLPDTKEAEVPKFVPLGGNAVKSSNPVPAPSQPSSSSSSSGFVFGQNLSDRVVVSENVNNGGIMDHSSTNGNSELLFTNAVASNAENNKDDNAENGAAEGADSDAGAGGLAAAAAEYERSHARPPVLAGGAPSTGEEDETNVLQMTCRLFAYESGSWRELGRGQLRLNDRVGGARLVFRVLGSLRVALNTQLWPAMVADRAGARSLRITAADASYTVKVFLIMATPSDIQSLHRELTVRIARASSLKSSAASHSESADYSAPPEDHLPDETHHEQEKDVSVQPRHDQMSHDEENYEQENIKNGGSDAEDNAKENQRLKRKETADDSEVSPKRQCPEIVIE